MHVVTVTFGKHFSTIQDGFGHVLDVRRLSSLSSTRAGGWRKEYSTHWMWYWKDGTKKWREYPKQVHDCIHASMPLVIIASNPVLIDSVPLIIVASMPLVIYASMPMAVFASVLLDCLHAHCHNCSHAPGQCLHAPIHIVAFITPLTNILPFNWFRAPHMICLSFTRRRLCDSASFAV